MSEPLIVTALLDAPSFATLDTLRRRHFPKALNKVPAHVSLFHHLPGEDVGSIRTVLAQACRGMHPFDLVPMQWRSLGRGVAIAYDAPELSWLHGQLAKAWAVWLTAQDRQPFRAHVTIQNKVQPAVARALLEELQETSDPPTCRVAGLTLWRYLGGPWERLESYEFGNAES